ncbi:MAG: hypothetical protein V3S39_01950 [Thermodesulfobacteriota bacterium]
MCNNCCGIKVKVVDGVVVEIRGDPDNPNSRGKLCAKGQAGKIGLYIRTGSGCHLSAPIPRKEWMKTPAGGRYLGMKPWGWWPKN